MINDFQRRRNRQRMRQRIRAVVEERRLTADRAAVAPPEAAPALPAEDPAGD